MKALVLAHAYLIGATIHSPKGNRSPTKEEVLKAILEELQTEDRRPTHRVWADDHARNRRPTED